MKEYKKAKHACQKALKLMPELIQAQLNLASVYLETEELERAISLLEEVVKRKEDYSEALSNLAYA